jgi:hypothetical protein
VTAFVKEATRQLSPSSVRVYLYAALPFFAFLDLSRPRGDSGEAWNLEPEVVRQALAQYLEEQLGCVIRRHRLGFELVSVTGRSRGNVGALLAALKPFYSIMREVGCYAAENPLTDATARGQNDNEEDGADTECPPKMPDISGEVPRLRRRLTHSFFKLVGKDWVPQIIDDPTFPVAVLTGEHKVLVQTYAAKATPET